MNISLGFILFYILSVEWSKNLYNNFTIFCFGFCFLRVSCYVTLSNTCFFFSIGGEKNFLEEENSCIKTFIQLYFSQYLCVHFTKKSSIYLEDIIVT